MFSCKMKISHKYLFLSLVFLLVITPTLSNKKGKLPQIKDAKDFKKLLRTKTNVLALFINSMKQSGSIMNLMKDVAETVKGQGTIIYIDCSGETKKMCKKLKVSPTEDYVLKHYKDGEFHKNYDRKMTVSSFVNFMRDPTGDIPWEEEDSASDVVHLTNPSSLFRLLQGESKGVLIMFYAPWCGFCKQLKPEFSKAASEVKRNHVLAAIDVNQPENYILRRQFNITGFPTLLYFINGEPKYVYEGENKKESIKEFLKNPGQAPKKSNDENWVESMKNVVHLKNGNFDEFIKGKESVLVMFYAPWCGHCKRLKPEFDKAAQELKSKNIKGVLAAVDATQETELASRFNIKGFPVLKYFKDGSFTFDVPNAREVDKIISFMKDPKEPPPPPPPEKPWSEEKSEVVHLEKSNFKEFLKKKKHVLVAFYAPWCGYCKKMKPEFTAAAEELKDDSRMKFAAVDCTTSKELCEQYEVQGYPTFIYFHYFNKETRKFTGGMTKKHFVNFLRNLGDEKQTPETSKPYILSSQKIMMTNDQNFTSVVNAHSNILVLFYTPTCSKCEDAQKAYLQVAETSGLHPLTFTAVDVSVSPKLAEKYASPNLPSLKFMRNGNIVADYSGKYSSDGIIKFVKSHLKIQSPKEEL